MSTCLPMSLTNFIRITIHRSSSVQTLRLGPNDHQCFNKGHLVRTEGRGGVSFN